MSDYPPAPPYGAGYGSQPATHPSYLPPYPNQYMQQDDGHATQTHLASNYDTSVSAYGYNSSIPGFTAAVAPAAPLLPIYQGWNQDAIPLPTYSTPHSNMQYTGYGGNTYQSSQSYSAPPQQTYHSSTQHAAPYDEGELSEGEFDVYRGQNTGAAASASYGSSYYHGNDGSGYMNSAHRAVFPGGQDYNSQQHQQYPSGRCLCERLFNQCLSVYRQRLQHLPSRICVLLPICDSTTRDRTGQRTERETRQYCTYGAIG